MSSRPSPVKYVLVGIYHKSNSSTPQIAPKSPFAATGMNRHKDSQVHPPQNQPLAGGLARAFPFAQNCYACSIRRSSGPSPHTSPTSRQNLAFQVGIFDTVRITRSAQGTLFDAASGACTSASQSVLEKPLRSANARIPVFGTKFAALVRTAWAFRPPDIETEPRGNGGF